MLSHTLVIVRPELETRMPFWQKWKLSKIQNGKVRL